MPNSTPDPNSSSRLERFAAKVEAKGQEMQARAEAHKNGTRYKTKPTWSERLAAKAEELDRRRLEDLRRRNNPDI